MKTSVLIIVLILAVALLPGAGHLVDPAQSPGPTQVELAAVRQELQTTKADLLSAADRLSATQTEMASISQELQATKAALSSTTDQLSATQAELASAKQALSNATVQVGRRNPTYVDAVQFIREDQTNLRAYDPNLYTCLDFAADVIKNAEARGIRAAYVSIRLRQGSHAVVAFDTVDKGLVYFEPQTDKEVVLPLGQSYLQVNGYAPLQSQDDTITRLTIVW